MPLFFISLQIDEIVVFVVRKRDYEMGNCTRIKREPRTIGNRYATKVRATHHICYEYKNTNLSHCRTEH